MSDAPRTGRVLASGSFLIAALALVAVLPSACAAAWPRSEFRAWVERQHAEWGPYGTARHREEWVYHLDGVAFPANSGAWSLWMDASERGREFRLTGADIPTTVGRMAVHLGDFAVGNERGSDLASEFHSPVWLRGAGWGLRRGDLRVNVRGGALTERQGGAALGRASIDSGVLGLGLGGSLGSRRRWDLSWDRQQALPERPAGLQVSRLLVAANAARGWSWLGDLSVSREDGSSHLGTTVVAGFTRTGEHSVISGHARRIAPAYRDLGLLRAPHENEWGARLETGLRPRPAMYLGAAADWARDLTRRADGLPPEERVSLRAFSTVPLIRPLYVQTTAAYRARSTVDPDSLLVDQGVLNGGGEIGWRTRVHGGSLGYSRGLFRDPAQEAGDWHEDRVTARLSERLGEALHVELLGASVDRRLPNGRWTSRERRLESRIAWDPGDERNLWLSLARERQEADDEDFERDQWQIGGGWRQGIFGNLTVGVEGFAYVRAGARDPDAARVNLRLSRSFSFGGGRLETIEGLPEFGSVRGVVFEDLNANGHRDAGEPGIPGLTVRLGSGEEMITARDGSYRLEHAEPGLDFVLFDPARLATRYLAPARDRIPLRLSPGEDAVADFAIRRAAGVEGRVVARDASGSLIGVPDILIRLRGSHHDVFTDGNGQFVLTGLNAGPATLEIAEWSLPRGVQLGDSAIRELVLESGRQVTAAPIVLRRVEPEVRQRFRNESD